MIPTGGTDVMADPEQARSVPGVADGGAGPADPAARHRWAMAVLDELQAVDTIPGALQRLAELMMAMPADIVVVDLLQADGTLSRMGECLRPGFDRAAFPLRQAALQHWRHPSREVVSTARPLRGKVNDAGGASRFAHNPDAIRQLLQLGPLAYVFVPLKAGGRVFAALGVGRFGEDAAFSLDEVTLIEDIASRAGLVMQTLIQKQEAEAARAELASQASVRRVVSESARTFAEASLSVRDALQRVTRLVSDQVGGVCVIRLLDDRGQWDGHPEVYHPDAAVRQMVLELFAQPMSPQDGISARAIASGRSVFLPDVDDTTLQGMLAKPAQGHVSQGSQHSLMCVPLRVQGRSIGVIICSAVRARGVQDGDRLVPLASRPYTVDDLRLCEELADLASMAIDHARLFELNQIGRMRAEQDAARLATLQQITSQLSAASSPDEVMGILLTEGGAALGAVYGAVGLVGARDDTVRHRRQFGMTPQQDAIWQRIELDGSTVSAEAVRAGAIRFVEDGAELAGRYDWARSHPETVPGAMVVMPLMAQRRVVGTMGFGFSSPRTFDEPVRLFVAALGAQATSALERAMAYQAGLEAQREAEVTHQLAEGSLLQAQEALLRLERLQRLTGELSAALTVAEVAEIVCREGKLALDARLGAVLVMSDDGTGLDLVSDDGMMPVSRQTWGHIPLSAPTHVTEAVRTGLPVLYTTRESWMAAYPGAASQSAIIHGTSLALPMVVHGRVFGCLAYAWQDEHKVTTAGLQFAEAVAAQAAQAFERSRLFQQSQEAVRMRDEFLSMASHELRTPLTTLKLHLDMLCRQIPADPAALVPVQVFQPRLQRLGRQADRLAKLILELLDVARVSQGRLPLDIEDVDLREVVREVADRHTDELARQGCALWLQCAPAVGAWDRSRLDQVVTNLLSNALKYGAGKPITVTTAVEGAEAVLTVKDQGIGIAAENHQRVFERFERLVSARHYAGFGIGLWIVAEVVQAFGGHITVDSVPGEGATFIVRLPLRPPVPSPAGPGPSGDS